jgi:hypothetical protein
MVIEGTFKEKELKQAKARPFGKLTWEGRLLTTARQHNLADKLFPYFDEQAMVLTMWMTSSFTPKHGKGTDVS